MAKALALPEILACIGSMLNDKDIISCMLVCKSWTLEFEPFLWRSFTLKQFDPTRKEGRPQLDQLLKNARYIRQLVIEHMDPAIQDFFMQCKQLEEVKFDAQNADEGDTKIWNRFSEMIEDHGRLRKIVIDQIPWAMTDQVLETMESCPKLIVLETKEIESSVARTQLYLRVCSKKLRRLSTWSDYYYSPKFPEHLVFQEMRYLDICHATGMSMDLQLTWLSRCPNLISFHWESWAGQVDVDKLCDVLSGGACPNLTALHLIVTLTDAEVAMVLDAAPRIEKLSLPKTGFGALSLIALRKHFPTLRDINLQFCPRVTSPMVQEILRTCANLQSISAEILHHSDIIRQPWACRGLQMFDVGIDVAIEHEAPISNHKEVYERLAQFTELNYLSICSETQEDHYNPYPIKVTIDAGLAALETLKKLTFFSCKTLLDDCDPGEAFEAVEWMVRNWRRLETFEATKDSIMGAMDDEGSMVEPCAMDILIKNGIKFTEYDSDRGLGDEDGDFYEGDGWTDYEEHVEYDGYDGFESDFSYYEGYEHFGPYSDDDDD
ncbi:hypothetical protein BGX24_001718 [Mortierella sp. AD032]|nr:hypothetical protein BGX24_001718 [Mortierella sp. AD032]